MAAPQRRSSREIRVGGVAVGNGHPVSVQSMTNTDTRDAEATLAQINRLAALGCDLIRVAVPDREAAAALKTITRRSPLPVIADIHFDYTLALAAIDNHVAAVRLNPGNLSDRGAVGKVAMRARDAGIPIRIGANSGSVRPALVREMMDKGLEHGDAMAEALVISALRECEMLENFGFHDIKVLKSNLASLPFPRLTPEGDASLSRLTDDIRTSAFTSVMQRRLDDAVYSLFGIPAAGRRHIGLRLAEAGLRNCF